MTGEKHSISTNRMAANGSIGVDFVVNLSCTDSYDVVRIVCIVVVNVLLVAQSVYYEQ